MAQTIEYLESLMPNSRSLRRNIEHPVRSVTVEIKALYDLGSSLVQKYEDKILPLTEKFKLIELIALNKEFEQIGLKFKPLEYLSTISEMTLWDFYQPAIECPECDPGRIEDLGNKESLNKLKMRSFNERLMTLEQNFNNGPRPSSSVMKPKE
jgi:hypothetical protein